MKIILSIIFIVLAVPHISLASTPSQPEHYCDDKESWQTWDHILYSNPENNEVVSLYAFRVGLCSMVKPGKIETIRATHLFERMRDIVLKVIEKESGI